MHDDGRRAAADTTKKKALAFLDSTRHNKYPCTMKVFALTLLLAVAASAYEFESVHGPSFFH